MNLQHLADLNKRRLNSQSLEERDGCFYLLSHDLIEAFPEIEKELLASRELVERLRGMDIRDCEEDDCQHQCSQRNPLWRSQREKILKAYEGSIKE